MTKDRAGALAAGVVLAALAELALTQGAVEFPGAQVRKGSDIYAQNCAPCHGPRMLSPEVPVDLRKFPQGEKSRFITSVAKGKNQMPPFGGLYNADEIEALWAYVMAGEK